MTNAAVKFTSSKLGAWLESELDFTIHLSSAGPVSIDLVTDLQRFVSDQFEPDVKVGAFVFQEAKVHEGILPE